MSSSPITSWLIDGDTIETVPDFIVLASKITADGDCSHEIKRHLLSRRKAMTNLGSILKSRDITLPTKVHLVKAMVFQIWKTQQWPQDWKRSVFIPIPKKGNAKECSNYCTIALISHVVTHSSVLAWRVPGSGEPGGLPSLGLHRVGHN